MVGVKCNLINKVIVRVNKFCVHKTIKVLLPI